LTSGFAFSILTFELVAMMIRPMTIEDKPSVTLILENTPEFILSEVALADEVVDAYLADPEDSGYFVLVAEIESKIAGYVCYGPTPITDGTWDIYWIAVDRNAQSQGVGRRLMNEAEEKIKQAKGRLVLVDTSSKPGYEKTNAFYRHIGYRESCRIKDFYAIGDDRITYEKRFNF
jgi:ribosomal protein S18 acetylase RimI-like enzyme